jgi:hypothetical protein
MQAKAQRFLRYEKRENQYNQNKMFKEDTEIFYRNLGMKDIQSKEDPRMPKAEAYWKSLGGEEAQHNVRAEWIRREQNRKIGQKDWGPYRYRKLL